MTTYMEKYPRRNGVAAKKPGFWKRLIKGIIPWKGDSVAAVIRKLVFIIALIVFLATAIPLVSDVFMMFRDQWRSQGISNIYIPDGNSGGASKEILPSFKKLLEINPDTVGYLKIDGTAIDYPVVKGKDNDYYLTHDFYGEKSKSGSVMMDCNCVVSPDGNSGNMVLYGHNMANGSMFATLHRFYDADFFNKNRYIYVYTPDRKLTYEIVSAFEYDNRHIMNSFDFSDDNVFSDYLNMIKNPHSVSVNKRNTELTTDDKILVLSTCLNSGDGRYLVQGVLKKDEPTK